MKNISDFSGILEKRDSKIQGWLPVSTRSDGSRLGIPVTVITGKEPGPTLLIEATCHGDETEGSLAAVETIRELSPDEIRGTLVVVPVLNVRAYESGTRGNPDERYNYDMNRLFPGDSKGSVSQKFIHTYVEQLLSRVDYAVSLHGGGKLFYLTNRVMVSTDSGSIELAKAIGPEWPFLHESEHPGTLMTECANRDIPCVTAELGGSSNRMPDAIMKNVGAFKKAIRNVMKHLEMLDGEAQYAEEWGILKGTNVRCTYGGLMIPTEKCRIKQEVKKGDHLVTIVDLFGEELDRIRAPQDGMVLGVPVLPLAYPGNNILTIAKVTEPIR